jgi:hypothetical protein
LFFARREICSVFDLLGVFCSIFFARREICSVFDLLGVFYSSGKSFSPPSQLRRAVCGSDAAAATAAAAAAADAGAMQRARAAPHSCALCRNSCMKSPAFHFLPHRPPARLSRRSLGCALFDND